MQMNKDREWMWIALCFSGALLCVYSSVAMIVRTSMYSDSGWGFLVWDAMRRGAPFNHGMAPDPANIAQDVTGFMTWWSPGQYWLPGLLELIGLDLGQAIVATVALASGLGLAGWYRLYSGFGFPRRTAAITVAMIACTRFYGLPFGIYNGGEVLIFAVAPWVIYALWRIGDVHLRHIPVMVLGIAILFFAKLTGVVLGGAVIAGLVLKPGEGWLARATLRRGIVGALAVTIFSAAFYYCWLLRGPTPATGGLGINLLGLPAQLAFSINAVWSSSLSVGDLASYLLVHPNRPILGSLDLFNFVSVPFALAAVALVWSRLGSEFGRYRLFFAVTAAAYITVLMLLSVRGAAIGRAERHLRPISLMLLIGMVQVSVGLQNRLARHSLAVAAVVFTLYGLASFASHSIANAKRPLDWRGLRHPIADQAALNTLQRIDVTLSDGSRPVVLVPSPEIGLVLRNSRVLAIHADFESSETLGRRVYRGRVGRIYVLVQTKLVVSGKADIILLSFKDYRRDMWKPEAVGSFTLFAQ
jgi:hypothetical protein